MGDEADVATEKLPEPPAHKVSAAGCDEMEGDGFTTTTHSPVDCVKEVLQYPSFTQRVYVVVVDIPEGGSYVAVLLDAISTPLACHL